jgi:tetratricopeptide (TPR) repeat protein
VRTVFALIGLSALLGQSASAQTGMYERLYAAYAAGNHTVVLTELNSVEQCRQIQPTVVKSTALLLTPPTAVPATWQRTKAAFLLELANDLSQCAPKESLSLLSTGRSYVMSRPTLLSANASDDAFELKWHLLAVAILQRERASDAADVYLDTMERRYVASQTAKAAHSTLDPRFVLMRAITAEQRAMSGPGLSIAVTALDAPAISQTTVPTQPVTMSSTSSPSLYTSATAARPDKLRAAAYWFEKAAAMDAVAPEAYVRLAAVRLQIGAVDHALDAIQRANVPASDRALAYLAGLWRGRILSALGRTKEAEGAFAEALDAWPTGQAAGVGVALMRWKLNRRAEAAEMSARVQAMPPGAPDPWWTYFGGAGRFVGAWLADLRMALE